MSVDLSRFGTRLTLNERFALLRKDSKKRSVMTQETIGSPRYGNAQMDRFDKFAGTVRDRPSAELHQGSEKNRRLVLEMASQPSVLAELSQYLRSSQSLPAPTVTPARPTKSVHQRLSLTNKKPTGDIKSRLKLPVRQRLNFAARITRVSPNNNVIRKSRNPNAMMKRKNIQSTRPFANTRFSINRNPNLVKGQRNTRKPVTAEQLDQDLDVYMQSNTGSLF